MNSKSPRVRGNVLLINFAIFIEYLQVQRALPGIERGRGLRYSLCLRKAHRIQGKLRIDEKILRNNYRQGTSDYYHRKG